jgi:hypothetical protein
VKCKCIVPHAYEIRIQRAWWMRMLPFSAAYYCTHCQVKSLQFRRRPATARDPVIGSRH